MQKLDPGVGLEKLDPGIGLPLEKLDDCGAV